MSHKQNEQGKFIIKYKPKMFFYRSFNGQFNIAKVKIMILGSNRAIEKLQLVKSVIILGKGTPGQAGYFEGRYEKVSGRL